jgi:hypothetical protein
MILAGRPPCIAGKSVYLVCFKWKPGCRVLLRLAIQQTDLLQSIELLWRRRSFDLLYLQEKKLFKNKMENVLWNNIGRLPVEAM